MNAAPALRILGSAAGGGYPQWNCRCPVCQLAWSGDDRVVPRTQSSLAIRAPDGGWVLINASPDIRQQILDAPALHPRRGLRHSPVSAVILTNADVDHIAGLLGLRERWPLKIFTTASILAALSANPLFQVLANDLVERIQISPETAFSPAPGLSATLFPVPGKAPLWGETETVRTDVEDGRTVGVSIESEGQNAAFYIPGCAAMTLSLRQRLEKAGLVLFDGTLFTDDEMIRSGLGEKTGRRMGHMPVSGPGGSLEAFANLGIGRKVYIHINNSNPMLIKGSPERRMAETAGWIVGEDGMEFAL